MELYDALEMSYDQMKMVAGKGNWIDMEKGLGD